MKVHYRFISLIAGIVLVQLLIVYPLSASSEKDLISQWAGAVNQDLGCLSLGMTMMGVNLSALGMVQDQAVLQGFGFKFGEGPYRTSATRIDTGRYLVSVQAMGRPNDHQKKEILLKTKADTIYPVQIPKAPRGKYTWNSAIQYDMENQLGILPHYEMDAEPVGFVDIRIQDPEKLAAFGFSGYGINDTSCQIIYKGNNHWEFNPGKGILRYENNLWTAPVAVTAPAVSNMQQKERAVSQPLQKTETQPAQPDPSLLFTNSDFEMGDLTNWTETGDAFAFQPTKGDNPTARGRKGHPSRHQGEFWIGTFEKYQGNPNEHPGQRQGDRPTGTLTSVLFEIKSDRISFLIGGGKHAEKETVALLVDGKPVLSVTGRGHESLQQQVWDVGAYKGKQAHILITDWHSGGWGHINADDFRYMDME